MKIKILSGRRSVEDSEFGFQRVLHPGGNEMGSARPGNGSPISCVLTDITNGLAPLRALLSVVVISNMILATAPSSMGQKSAHCTKPPLPRMINRELHSFFIRLPFLFG